MLVSARAAAACLDSLAKIPEGSRPRRRSLVDRVKMLDADDASDPRSRDEDDWAMKVIFCNDERGAHDRLDQLCYFAAFVSIDLSSNLSFLSF